MTKFKVGDRVIILPLALEAGVGTDAVGRIGRIIEDDKIGSLHLHVQVGVSDRIYFLNDKHIRLATEE
jgi:hypothetical protein